MIIADDHSLLDFESAVQYMQHFIYHFTNYIHDVYYSRCLNSQFRFVNNLKLTFNWFPLAPSAHKFSLAKMASEAKKPLAKI